MLRRLAVVTALAFGALLALAPPAWAHVELEPEEAVAGSTETLTFSVEHGKDGAATTGLVVQLPDGAAVTEVPPKDGWTSEVDEAEHTVAWSGGSAPDEDSFSVVVQLPTTPGLVLFPTIQETEAGELAWIDQEESEAEDAHPAPRVTLVADPNASATTTTTEAATTTTDADLPGTTLEAEERDDGNTSAAPWVIGSGIAAVVAIAIGGTILKRRAS